MSEPSSPPVHRLSSQAVYNIHLGTKLGQGNSPVYYTTRVSSGGERAPAATKYIARATLNEDEYLDDTGRESDGVQVAGALVTSVAVTPQEVLREKNGLLAIWSLVLGANIKQCWELAGPFPPEAAMAVIADTAHLLAELHALPGGQHRDLKSENVMLTPCGQVKVPDFGTIRTDYERRSKTASGAIPCSLLYVPPEALVDGRIGPPADVYQLGIMSFEMICGREWGGRPLTWVRHDQTMAARIAAMRSTLPPGCEAREEFTALLSAMLAFAPEDRPTASEVCLGATRLQRQIRGGGLRELAARVVPAAMPIKPCWSLLALPDTSLEHSQEGHDWEDEEACSQADDRDEEEALEAVLVDTGEDDGHAALDDEEETQEDLDGRAVPAAGESDLPLEDATRSAQHGALASKDNEAREDEIASIRRRPTRVDWSQALSVLAAVLLAASMGLPGALLVLLCAALDSPSLAPVHPDRALGTPAAALEVAVGEPPAPPNPAGAGSKHPDEAPASHPAESPRPPFSEATHRQGSADQGTSKTKPQKAGRESIQVAKTTGQEGPITTGTRSAALGGHRQTGAPPPDPPGGKEEASPSADGDAGSTVKRSSSTETKVDSSSKDTALKSVSTSTSAITPGRVLGTKGLVLHAVFADGDTMVSALAPQKGVLITSSVEHIFIEGQHGLLVLTLPGPGTTTLCVEPPDEKPSCRRE